MGPHNIARILQCPSRTKEEFENSISRLDESIVDLDSKPSKTISNLPYWIEQRAKEGSLMHAVLQYSIINSNGFEKSLKMLDECNINNNWTDEFKASLKKIDKRLEFFDYKKSRANSLIYFIEDFRIFIENEIDDFENFEWQHEKPIEGEFETPFGPWNTKGLVDIFGENNERKILIELKSPKVSYPKDEWIRQVIIYENIFPEDVESYLFYPHGPYKITESDFERYDSLFDVEGICEGCYLCQEYLR